jgi:hypothetical protein
MVITIHVGSEGLGRGSLQLSMAGCLEVCNWGAFIPSPAPGSEGESFLGWVSLSTLDCWATEAGMRSDPGPTSAAGSEGCS